MVSRLAHIPFGLLWALTAVGIGAARADDLDRMAPYRVEINDFIDVLSKANAVPSQACLTALDEMHTTDHQLKELTGQLTQGGEAPEALDGQRGEVGIARDVLASDLQNAAERCRPDTERVCVAAGIPELVKRCETAQKAIEGERPAQR